MAGHITKRYGNDEMCVEWKIPDFLERQDVLIKSPLFYYADYNFSLEIYPKGENWFEEIKPITYVSMRLLREEYLSNNYKAIEYKNIEYVMGLILVNLTKIGYPKDTSKLKSGVLSSPAHKLILNCTLGCIKKYVLPKGILSVFCNIRCEKLNSAVSVVPPTLSKYGTLSENFEALYRSKRLTDVTITVLDKEFHAHKLILSTRSEVFNSMFQHDTSELRSGVVHITDCDPHSFEDFLLYLYTGKTDTVSSTNAVSLFKTADKYGVVELRRECIRCIIQGGMTVDSFCNVFQLAALHGESDLLACVTDFFIKNANSILNSKEWLSLLEEHASLCNKLLVKFSESTMQK